MITFEQQEQFIQLRAKGHSFDSISKTMGISKPTLIKISHIRRYDIENYKQIEHEVLREKYLITQNHMIIMFGNQLESLRIELSGRDLSSISTQKLIELMIILSGKLSEYNQPMILSEEGLDPVNERKKWIA